MNERCITLGCDRLGTTRCSLPSESLAHFQIAEVFLFTRLVFGDTEKNVEAKFSVEYIFGESVIASVDNGAILLFQIEGVNVFVRD